MITLVAALALTAQTPTIGSLVQPAFKDASFVARVVRSDQRELRKINDDFGQSYRFDTTHIQVKEPFKLRLTATVEDTNILYVINGTRQAIRIPRARINTKQNLANSPGRRQTLLDFGLLTPSLFEDLFEAKFVRLDRATGDAVFDLTYPKRLDDTSRHRIWVDRERKIITRREWYSQRGRQLATFLYESPTKVDGIWLPTRLTVRNVDDKVAGITRYDAIKVNTGLADDLFEVK